MTLVVGSCCESDDPLSSNTPCNVVHSRMEASQSSSSSSVRHEDDTTEPHWRQQRRWLWQPPAMEWVLTVPPRYTQIAYKILVDADHCVARPWHLEGRYGSRTHRHCNERMAIPILSASHVTRAATAANNDNNNSTNAALVALRELLEMTDDQGHRVVEMVYKPYTVSRRYHEPPAVDARIHLERAPTSWPTIITTSATDQAAFVSSLTTSPVRKVVVPPATAGLFTYAELFAGIGGFGVALEALGGKCVFCSELEESCRQIYTANLQVTSSDNDVMHGDIYAVADADLPSPNNNNNHLDLLVGGFPCQPFSAMGSQPGFDCPKGHLFTEIVRVLTVSQPKAFLLENVPGLLQMPETFHTIVTALQNVGYVVSSEVCDARGLTATSRKRLYLVGLLRRRQQQQGSDDDNDSNQMPPVPTTPFEFPFIPDLGLRACNVIQYEPLNDVAQEKLLRITDAQLQRMDSEKYWRPAHLAWPNSVCNTLVSHYGNSVARGHSQLVPGSVARMMTESAAHPLSSTDDSPIVLTFSSSNPRRFTPRECARIMGFPNTFVLPEKQQNHGSERQGDMARTKELYRMLGNAVCPPLIAALSGAVLDRCGLAIPFGNDDNQCTKTTITWVDWGRMTAIRLAYAATINKSSSSSSGT